MTYFDAFQKEKELIRKLGEGNAYLVWSMALYLDHSDIEELAADCLTDGSDDKKIDFIRLDPDLKRIIFAQGYFSSRKVDRAPSNKASDLNTAAAWLVSGDTNSIPRPLREAIIECRKALEEGEIEQIELLFVHNLPESANVANELNTAAAHLFSGLSEKVAVVGRELGIEALERLYSAKESAIQVGDEVLCPAEVSFEVTGPKWKAGTLSVPASWLRELFLKFGDQLFSANYRGFLGISKRKKINTGIRQTAESDPENFWVFNNGITILTLGYAPKNSGTCLNGISIINGAQTTGSLGSVDLKHDLSKVRVLCRIIQCRDSETINSIVRFNNTQNEITTWDQYSNDETQKRIAKEFQDLGHVYSLKRGFNAGQQAQLGIEQVATPTLAFEGKFQDANRGKNLVFERSSLYRETFDGKKARHLLLTFTLAKAIDERRIQLKEKKVRGELIEIEQRQLDLYRNLRFKNFLIAIMGQVLETLLGISVNLKEIAFTPNAAKVQNYSLPELTALWLPVVNLVTTQISALTKPPITDIITEDGALDDMAEKVKALIYATQISGPNPLIEKFKKEVSPRG